MSLYTHGYNLIPGFAQTKRKEKVSPITHINTIYDGDTPIKDILEDYIDFEDESDYCIKIPIVPNPQDWIFENGIWKYIYYDNRITSDNIAEVSGEKNTMYNILKNKIRWIIAGDCQDGYVELFSERQPYYQLSLTIILYKNFQSLPIYIDYLEWVNNGVLETVNKNIENITDENKVLLKINKDNINYMINNEILSIESYNGYISVFTDIKISITGTIIIFKRK